MREQQRPSCHDRELPRNRYPVMWRGSPLLTARRRETSRGPASLSGGGASVRCFRRRRRSADHRTGRGGRDHLVILVTLPEPTVRPPSRMAKPRPSSMAIGWISSTDISVLSPGMTISVPSGSVMTPVTSVVRK